MVGFLMVCADLRGGMAQPAGISTLQVCPYPVLIFRIHFLYTRYSGRENKTVCAIASILSCDYSVILIMAKALGKLVIFALVRLQTQRGRVIGNALS
jgi:hypothetical protein